MGLQITRAQYDRILAMFASINDEAHSSIELEARIAKPVDPYAFQRVLAYLTSTIGPPQKEQEVLDITASRDFPSVRISIPGLEEISAYCKTGAASSINGMRKTRTGQPERIDEHNIIIKVSDEQKITNQVEVANTLAAMKASDKLFRMKKRTSFTISDDFRIDCTLVRSSNGKRLSTSSINTAPISHEIEIEYIGGSSNSKPITNKSPSTSRNKPESYATPALKLLSLISEVLKVVDDCEYLITNTKSLSVVEEYHSLAFPGQKFDQSKLRYNPKSLFIGPQPISMELRNLLDPKFAADSVQVNYTVTHKADGERNLVFVDRNGDIFLINNRLVVKPIKLRSDANASSIFDAEVINLNSSREVHIFDAYIARGQNIATLPLESNSPSGNATASRMSHARSFVSAVSHSKDGRHHILAKTFEIIPANSADGIDLYRACRKLLQEQQARILPYTTDGLIFTPLSAPAGALPGSTQPRLGGTWMLALKWKPAHDNTIDFLAKTRKVPGAQKDELQHNTANTGMCKTLDLYVGTTISDTTAWEYCNNSRPRKGYLPMPFEPAGIEDPSSVNSTQVPLDSDGFMRCKNGDIIVDDSIVEMAWTGPTGSSGQTSSTVGRWDPLRVRVDKTELYKATRSISGTANNSEVAERVWSSIVHPVTDAHITGAIKVAQDMIPMDIGKYYVNNNFVDRGKTLTINMANFHNLWVKNRHLIGRFNGKAKSLADLGCGKGGDLGKWIDAGFTKVLGLDLYSDNLNNAHNGLYRRLQKMERRSDTQYSRNTHTYLFFPFDVSNRITKDSISVMPNEHERTLASIAFGYTKSPGPELRYLESMAASGFDLVSSQFAIHYFFKNNNSLENFMFNVDRCMQPGGYFVGTCFDGASVARALETTDFISGEKDGKVIWSIQRKYELPFQPMQTGQAVKVFMETISQPIDEYLVHYEHLVHELSKYNIHPLTQEECAAIGVTQSSGLFSELFSELQEYVTERRRRLPQHEMWMLPIVDNMASSEAEKRISFFNRWFIFKKAGAKTESAPQNPPPPAPPPTQPKKRVTVRKPPSPPPPKQDKADKEDKPAPPAQAAPKPKKAPAPKKKPVDKE